MEDTACQLGQGSGSNQSGADQILRIVRPDPKKLIGFGSLVGWDDRIFKHLIKKDNHIFLINFT